MADNKKGFPKSMSIKSWQWSIKTYEGEAETGNINYTEPPTMDEHKLIYVSSVISSKSL